MKKFKRTLCLLLSVLMIATIFTALPFTASAATVDDDSNVGSTFISYDSSGSGVSFSTYPSGIYNAGEECTFEVVAFPGNTLTSVGFTTFSITGTQYVNVNYTITENGVDSMGRQKYTVTFTVPDESSITVKLNDTNAYAPEPAGSISITTQAQFQGTITVKSSTDPGETVDFTVNTNDSYLRIDKVTVTATKDGNTSSVPFAQNPENMNNFFFVAPDVDSIHIKAEFMPDGGPTPSIAPATLAPAESAYSLTATAGEHGSVVETSGASGTEGTQGYVIFAPDNKFFKIDQVTSTGAEFTQDTENPNKYNFTYGTSNVTVNATFTDTYTVTVISPHGTYNLSYTDNNGERSVSITSINAASGYSFTSATSEDVSLTVLASVNTVNFSMPENDVTVTLIFERSSGNMKMTKNFTHCSSPDLPAYVDCGETINFTMVPDAGYRLNGSQVSIMYGGTIYPSPALIQNEFLDGSASYSGSVPNIINIFWNNGATATYSAFKLWDIGTDCENGSVAITNKWVSGRTTEQNATQGILNDKITLTVTPDAGYVLDSATSDDVALTVDKENNTITFTMPDEAVDIDIVCSPVKYFIAHSLTLKGDIGVNFLVDLHDIAPENAKVELSWYKYNKTYNGDLVPRDDNYLATVNVAAKEMADTITAKLYDGDTLVAEETYSVKTYADTVIKNEVTAEQLSLTDAKFADLQNLCKAMLQYGASCEAQFDAEWNHSGAHPVSATDGIDYTGYTMADIPDYTTPDYAELKNTYGIEYAGSSIGTKTTTNYLVGFKTSSGSGAPTMTWNGTEIKPQTFGTGVSYSFNSIPAKEITEDIEVSVGGSNVTFNMLAYIKAALAGTNDTLKTSVSAFYDYGAKAKTFFG